MESLKVDEDIPIIDENAKLGLNEPIAVFMGVSVHDYRYQLDDSQIDSVVETFQNFGVKSARYDSVEAEDSSYMIVSPTGLQSAFIPPAEFEDTAMMMESILNEVPSSLSGEKLNRLGLVHPVQIDQLMDPISIDEKNRINITGNGQIHPQMEKVEEILDRRGLNFQKEMLARTSSLPDAEFKDDGSQIYNGSPFPQPYLIAPTSENKAVVFGSIDSGVSRRYASNGVELNESLSFIKAYEPIGNTITGYSDYGIERGTPPVKTEESYETPIYPGSSRFKELILKVKESDGSVSYKKSPENDPEWQDFMELYRPGFEAGKNMLNRRNNQKQEQKNGNLKTHSIIAQVAKKKNELEQGLNHEEKTNISQINKEEISKIAELSGRSVGSLLKVHHPAEQKNKETPSKEQDIENKKENSDKKMGKQITIIRGLAKDESKAVNKSVLDLTQTRNRGNEK